MGEIRYSYRDVPTVKQFSMSNKFMRGLMGPFGCLAGDTAVITEQGPVPISDITGPTRVLSWNEKNNQFQLSLSGGAFPKGKDYLYRVQTQLGEFVAAGHHRVFCADRTYRRVDALTSGDSIICAVPPQTTEDIVQESLREDDLHCSQKAVNCLDHYEELVRLCGQQLHLATNSVQEHFPSLACVQKSRKHSYLDATCHTDDQSEPLPRHIHQGQLYGPTQIGDSAFRTLLQAQVSLGCVLWLIFSHILGKLRQLKQSQRKFSDHYTGPIFVLYSSCATSISEWSILSITREPVKREFWDMQVADTNNYVTVDGAIHHNSGKSSGCVIEIIKRAQAQKKSSEDGLRHSRWAVIRNSYAQLQDTSIQTFHTWLPPSIFGHWHATKHNYTITAFEGCHIEVWFRALDRPDQIDNLLSSEYTGAWINEAREVPWAIVRALQGRVGRYPRTDVGGCNWYGIIMDTNPPDTESDWYKYFEELQPQNAKIFKQPSGRSEDAENLTHLPENYYSNLAIGQDDAWVKVYIDGEYGFVQDGKPVHPEYVDTVHCAAEEIDPVKGIPIQAGLDFGLTPACILGQKLPNGRWIIVDEIISDNMGITNFAKLCLLPAMNGTYAGYDFATMFGDPAGDKRADTDEKTPYQILNEVFKIKARPCFTNDPTIRRDSLSGPLTRMIDGKPGLIISPRCKKFRKGLSGGFHYHRIQVSGTERYAEEPYKNEYSHPVEAGEYMLLGGGEGKTVLGRDKKKKVRTVTAIMAGCGLRSPI